MTKSKKIVGEKNLGDISEAIVAAKAKNANKFVDQAKAMKKMAEDYVKSLAPKKKGKGNK